MNQTEVTRDEYLENLVEKYALHAEQNRQKHPLSDNVHDGLLANPYVVVFRPIGGEWTHAEYSTPRKALERHPGLRLPRNYTLDHIPNTGAVIFNKDAVLQSLTPTLRDTGYHD